MFDLNRQTAMEKNDAIARAREQIPKTGACVKLGTDLLTRHAHVFLSFNLISNSNANRGPKTQPRSQGVLNIRVTFGPPGGGLLKQSFRTRKNSFRLRVAFMVQKPDAAESNSRSNHDLPQIPPAGARIALWGAVRTNV